MIKSGSVGVFSGDVTKIKEDAASLKPTFFASVPRLYNKIYAAIKLQFSQFKGMKKMLVDRAIRVKIENLHSSGSVTDWFYDRLVFSKIRAILGGRVRGMLTGSAPI